MIPKVGHLYKYGSDNSYKILLIKAIVHSPKWITLKVKELYSNHGLNGGLSAISYSPNYSNKYENMKEITVDDYMVEML